MRPGQKKQSKKDRPLPHPAGERPPRKTKPRRRNRKHKRHERQCRTPEPYNSDSNYDYAGYYGGDYDDNLD